MLVQLLESEQATFDKELEAVVVEFQSGSLSLGKAAERMGMNRLHFMNLLAQRGVIVFDYDENDVELELANSRHLHREK